MKILVFGSLNLDYVYQVEHIVLPGETISSNHLEVYPGGKGLNQAVALARAGATVCMAGNVGVDGDFLLQVCQENGVDCSLLRTVEERTGNAIIQVASDGQNSIVLFGGANQKNTPEYVDDVLSYFEKGDFLLLQNEVNMLDVMIEKAVAKGLKVALNPSPYDKKIHACDMNKVSLFFLNEMEGANISGHSNVELMLRHFASLYPKASVILTLGKDGVVFLTDGRSYKCSAYDVSVVDTTAAGDTFTGYFLHAFTQNASIESALNRASLAASLAVSQKGAVTSIPTAVEVDKAKEKLRTVTILQNK